MMVMMWLQSKDNYTRDVHRVASNFPIYILALYSLFSKKIKIDEPDISFHNNKKKSFPDLLLFLPPELVTKIYEIITHLNVKLFDITCSDRMSETREVTSSSSSIILAS